MSFQRGIDFLCYLFQEEVEEKLAADIRARLANSTCMSISEHEKLRAKLHAELLELHRVESRICWAMVERGEQFEWKRLHPWASLEIAPTADAKPK